MFGVPLRTVSHAFGVGVALLMLLMVTEGSAQHHGHGESRTSQGSAPLYDDLGTHHHPISTQNPITQRYFDQGVRLTYAFNYDEAIRSYREAVRLDSTCAMCYWGMAWAYGPNINAARDSAGGANAYHAIRRALELSSYASDKERAYIHAMATRYGENPTADGVQRDSAYARAMTDLVQRYPDDDAHVLAAEALMLLSPWDYWTADLRPKPGTDALLGHLRPVTETNREHAGACHFYIHAVEAAYPERAIPCADRIAQLMPGAGHVVHMPGHIYIRVGRYADAIEANRHALHADREYDTPEGRTGSVYGLALYPHNYHFLSFAATMAGQRGTALHAARQLAERVDTEMMRQPGLGALQHFLMSPARVMVRFGMWEGILREPAPPSDLPYPTGQWHFARGMALARTGRADDAARELARLRDAAAHPGVAGVTVWDLNTGSALLAVAERVLAGEIAVARGDLASGIAILEEAVRLEADLTYDEPPPWDLPVRDLLGAVLLAADRPADAERVYRAALDRFPENGWALFGWRESLKGQGKHEDAADVSRRLQEAWKTADVVLSSSRF